MGRTPFFRVQMAQVHAQIALMNKNATSRSQFALATRNTYILLEGELHGAALSSLKARY
jgi:hypothetical protein